MSSVFTGQTPASPDVTEGGGIAVGMNFIPAENGTVTGIRFFASTTVGGTYTGQLYVPLTDDDPVGTGTGTLLGSGILGGAPTAGAWNVITLDTPVEVTAGTVYRAVYHNTAGHYVATSAFPAFAGGGLTNGPLTAPPNGYDSGIGSMAQGVYRSSATPAYPSDSFNTSNYFADVVYEATPASGVADFGLTLTLATTGDAPGLPPSTGETDYPIAITLAATGDTPGSGQGTAAFSLVLSLATEGVAELARAIAPSEGSRLVYAISTSLQRGLLAKPLTEVTIYVGEAGSSLADIRTLDGEVIPGSVLITDQWSQLPLFRMPAGVDTVWAQVLPDGPRWPVYAREDDRIDTLEQDVDTLQGEVHALQAEVVPGLAADVAALQTDVSNLDIEVSALAADLSGQQEQVDDLTDDVETLEVEVGYLAGDVAGAESAITGLTDDVVALEVKTAPIFPVAVGESISDGVSAAVSAGGGVVQLANGTHTVSSSIVIPVAAPVVIQGLGYQNCKLQAANGLNGPVFISQNFSSLTGTQPVDPTLTASGPNGFTLQGFEIIGNQANQTTGWGIQIFGYGYTIRDVVIRDCKSGGLYTEFAHSGSYAATAKGVEARFYDLQIHHNGGNGWEMRGPNDSRAIGCLIWENTGIGFWAKTTAGASSANGVNLINCHVYGSAHTIGMLWDAQVFAAQCQSEGAASGGWQLVVRYADCVWVGGSIYDINPAGGNGGGVKIGDSDTSTFAVRFVFLADVNGFKGDTLAHSAVYFSASSNCFVSGRVGVTTAATFAIGGTPAATDTVNLGVSGGSATAANSLTKLRGVTTVDVGSIAKGFTLVNGNTDLFNLNSASARVEIPGAQQIRMYQGAYTNEKLRFDGSVGHLEVTSTMVPTVAAGVALGTTPPAVQIDATSNDQRGIVNFGSGTSPTTGAAVTVTFANAFSRAPIVIAQAKNSAGEALRVRVGAVSTTAFNINVEVAPAASQANTTYYVQYIVMG